MDRAYYRDGEYLGHDDSEPEPLVLIQKQPDGKWPAAALNVTANLIFDGLSPHFVPLSIRYGIAGAILDALSELQADGSG